MLNILAQYFNLCNKIDRVWKILKILRNKIVRFEAILKVLYNRIDLVGTTILKGHIQYIAQEY